MQPACVLALTVSLIALAVASIGAYVSLKERTAYKILFNILNYRNIDKLLKKLKQKPKKRYIVFEVLSDCQIDGQTLWRELRETIREVLGSPGLIMSGVALIYYNPHLKRGILRVRNTYKNQVLGSLGLIRRVSNCEVLVLPISTSGTLKSAKRILNNK